MLKYTHILKTIPFIVLLAIYSCDDNPSSTGSLFEVTVTDTLGTPIEGAILEGGMDWDYYRVITDSRGRAVMPGVARDVRTVIKKSNFFSIAENHLYPRTYVLTPTPKMLVEIGDIEGDLIRFEYFRILTINYQGEYRVYNFDGNSLYEILMVEFPHQVKELKLLGDELWYTTHQDGIYVYSLFNSLNPVELFHLDIEGYLKPFAVKDSLVVVGSQSSPGPIRVYSYHNDGTVTELDRIGDFSVNKIYFRGDYLIVTGYYSNLYTIFNLENPSDIRLVYNGHYGGFESSFLYGETLIIAPRYPGNVYIMVDLSDPTNPEEIGGFAVTGRLEDFINDSTAVGRYYYNNDGLCVFERAPRTNFQAVAMVSEFYAYRFHHGSAPPYFLIGGKLWKLEER
ncbi:MAG: hypothetical protein JSU85_01560 [Candidatus Zixiibacteriota bacterium]|nr:MAG: hypothetical protein JSU85_01560 [candidate division Zixibacteria bacterium]